MIEFTHYMHGYGGAFGAQKWAKIRYERHTLASRFRYGTACNTGAQSSWLASVVKNHWARQQRTRSVHESVTSAESIQCDDDSACFVTHVMRALCRRRQVLIELKPSVTQSRLRAVRVFVCECIRVWNVEHNYTSGSSPLPIFSRVCSSSPLKASGTEF